jgi:hypothetical protein
MSTRTRRPVRLAALGLAALLALSAAPSARAELEVGAEAVEVEAKEYVNTEPVKLSDLSGRLILLELWKTT